MSFADKFKSWFVTTEKDVLAVIVKIKHDIEIAETELSEAFAWLSNHSGEIAQAVKTVADVVAEIGAAGVGIPPGVQQAIRDANAAVAGLNALVDNQTKGTPQALVSAYVATKQAWAAADNATLAIVQAPPVQR